MTSRILRKFFCFSQLRWLWRREISRDERREKLRIPFGIGRMKKSKKYPNGGKLSKVWQIVWLWKIPFSHNVLNRQSKVSRSSFFFLRHPPPLPGVWKMWNMPVRTAASEAQMHTPTALLRPWHVPSGFMMAEGNGISLQNETNKFNKTSVPNWFFIAAAPL